MKQKITKKDLVENIYVNTNYDKQDIQNIVDKFLVSVKKTLEKGDSIELRGFGTFELRKRKGKEQARNPKTGEIVSVKPHYVAAFRAGQDLKEHLWNLQDFDE